MQIPEKTKETLIEIARTATDLQAKHNLILDTLAHVAGITGQYKIEGTYDSIVEFTENTES